MNRELDVQIAQVLYRRGEYVRQLNRMKKQVQEHKEALFHSRAPMMKRKEADMLLKSIQELLITFRRGELTLTFVGDSRQGKIAAAGYLTGIGAELLESNTYDPIPRTVHNIPNMAPGELRAELSFLTREEMLNLIKDWVSRISPQWLEQTPLEFDDIPYLPLAELEMEAEEGDAYKVHILNQLSGIVQDFDIIRTMCGNSNRIALDPMEILRYTAESNFDVCASRAELEYYYCHYAVKHIDLFSHFPWTDARIAISLEITDADFDGNKYRMPVLDKIQNLDAMIYFIKPLGGWPDYKAEGLCYEMRDSSFIYNQYFVVIGKHLGLNDNYIEKRLNLPRRSAGHSIMEIWHKPETIADHFQSEIMKPLLNNLSDVDRKKLESLQARVSALTGNEK